MSLPDVKVAVATGESQLNFRTANSRFRLVTRQGNFEVTAENLQVILNSAAVMRNETIFWHGVAHSQAAAEHWLAQARECDPDAFLWVFGLTPGKQGRWDPWGWRLYTTKRLDGFQYVSDDDLHNQITKTPVEISYKSISAAPSISIAAMGKIVSVAESFEITADDPIELVGAKVGKDYHWEHEETLDFGNRIWIDTDSEGLLCCGIDVGFDDYVASVNSSEMPADSPLEFLKAQVVAARSWLLANWGTHHPNERFVVCNGDHCQCFYGFNRIKELSRRAVVETAGEVLLYNGRICDARYAKVCGGVTEPGSNVWQFVDHPYLGHFRDLPDETAPDLSEETDFRSFLEAGRKIKACCSPDFANFTGINRQHAEEGYRWTVQYSPQQLREIIASRIDDDPGVIKEIRPLSRGLSGRLIEIEIVTAKHRMRISPELEIRRILSESHLPSSAFVIEQTEDGFKLSGIGWGHGVGMCQVGGVGLALNGWNYNDILKHYYRNTSVKRSY